MEYNVCEICGAKDGRAGFLVGNSDEGIPNACQNCDKTRNLKKMVIHSNLVRTAKEIEKQFKMLQDIIENEKLVGYELSGDCKKAFDKWLNGIGRYGFMNLYIKKEDDMEFPIDFVQDLYPIFDRLPFSMKYPIYEEFFDDNGIYIDTSFAGCSLDESEKLFRYNVGTLEKGMRGKGYSRIEMRKNAIDSANAIFNKELLN